MHDIVIETDRLTLRPLMIDDADDVFEWVGDERVSKYMVYNTYKSVDQVKDWLKTAVQSTKEYNFGFVRKSDKKLIGSGSIGFNKEDNAWEFGYNFRYDCWGMGYATEAAEAMIDYARQNLGAQKFMASHALPNDASGKVIEKCGLKFKGYGEFIKLDGSCKMQSKIYTLDYSE